MSKLRALIIDDEPLAHKVILEYAKDVPFLEVAGQCHLAAEAMAVLGRQDVDLIFLDIHMPKVSGLELLKMLDKKPAVIITSAHKEYALESFELDVCDYLHKPFRFQRFLKAVHKALEWHHLRQAAADKSPGAEEGEQEPGLFFIKSDKRYIQLSYKEAYFLESYGNYVKVWMEESFHLTPRTLASFETQLPGEDFLRIHKSYLVNCRHIDYLEGNQLTMKNGKRLPVGKSHRQALKEFIERNL